MTNYYIYDGNQHRGPYDLGEIKCEQLSPKTPIWYEGLPDWTPLERIPHLLQLVNTSSPFIKSSDASIPHREDMVSQTVKEQSRGKKLWNVSFVVVSILLFGIWAWSIYINESHTLVTENVQQGQDAYEVYYKEEKQRKINEELRRKNLSYRNNWSNYIAVSTNDYAAPRVVGIYGLEVTVSNKTDHVLDEVVADLTYIKANGNVCKTVQLPVDSIAARSEKTVLVDDDDEAVSVVITTRSILSKKMDFYYSAGYFSGNTADPNFCK